MPSVSTAPQGSVGASTAKTLRANAIRVLKITGVRGRRRGKR